MDSPEGSEHLEVDALKHMFRGIQLNEEHDEDAMVRQLLELCVTDLVVLEQDASHNPQHLQPVVGYI